MSRLGALFPWPLVGVALLLVALILLTPVLISNGAGPLLAQAELVVDRVAGGNTTNFYLHAVGATVRFASVSMAIASGFVWSGGYPTEPLEWTDWQNRTNVLASVLDTIDNPVAVYVSATYTSGGTSTEYVGLFAFAVTSIGQSGETLNVAVSPATAGVTVPASVAVSTLPMAILLQPYSGGPLT